ncbi:MAG: DNA mismatch repair endonuclease MutL [Firmicutes bacterium]|nr:DNA mismatch repair endonuclease MutL [Bacillota bacterium]
MAVINVLDRATSNLIAAGEVVERPCSVIKELVENSIDAHADAVTIEIRAGGSVLMRVTDNGCGMERDDVELCIRRHATSKIKSPSDLDSIGTLGFRGEALAAISSVSRFTVLSKRAENTLGTQLLCEGDTVLSVEEAGCPDGTTVIVRDLFFNQPARRKFLKRDRTEAAAVLRYVERLAVSHPEIAFKFISDGETKLTTAGNGKLFDAVYSVFGKEFASDLTKVQYTANGMTVSGFVTRPEFARSNRSLQSFFINKRFVKSKTMLFALEDAFKSYVKSDKFPGCVLFLELADSDVDVNVHPAKTEVRFTDEHAVYNAVSIAVRNALEALNNPISVNAEAPEKLREKLDSASHAAQQSLRQTQIHFEAATPIRQEKPQSPLSFNLPGTGENRVASGAAPTAEQQKLYDIPVYQPLTSGLSVKSTAQSAFMKPTVPAEADLPKKMTVTVSDAQSDAEITALNPVAADGVIRGILFDAYICYEANDTVYLIDKHAAHERILYEKLKKNQRVRDTQMLLEPVIIPLDSTDFDAIEANIDEVNRAGFILESFGASEFALRGVPTALAGLNQDALVSIIEKTAAELKNGGRATAADDLMDRMLFTAACKAAVKAGIPDNMHDYEWIVSSLKTIDNIIVCPHGRPVIVQLTKKQIEKMFLRS